MSWLCIHGDDTKLLEILMGGTERQDPPDDMVDGIYAQEVAKVYPGAIFFGDHGVLPISGLRLATEDQFIRWILTSDS